jgi:flagellar hook assembly protein FlgD
MKTFLTGLFTAILILQFTILHAQQPTEGTLTFSVKTVSNGGTYSPKNVLAIWIKDAAGNFVVSCKVMANARKQHLVKWVANSGNNVTDATTGATLSSHQAHTVTWNCHNANGILMPDGDYQVWVEYTSRNSASGGAAGPSTSFTFTKGSTVVNLTPANETYFQNIVLSYIPLNVSVKELAKVLQDITVYPNPFSSETSIHFTISNKALITANVIDIHGEIVTNLIHEALPAGDHTISWDGKNENGAIVKPGVYSIYIAADGYAASYRVIRL